MTNGTYTGQTDWRVGGVSKAYRSEVVTLSFVRSKQEIKKAKYNSDGLRQWIHIAEDGGLVVAE